MSTIIDHLSIIISVYNEECTIAKVLDKISRVTLIQEIQKELIIIKD